jgi:hypothetical protein
VPEGLCGALTTIGRVRGVTAARLSARSVVSRMGRRRAGGARRMARACCRCASGGWRQRGRWLETAPVPRTSGNAGGCCPRIPASLA